MQLSRVALLRSTAALLAAGLVLLLTIVAVSLWLAQRTLVHSDAAVRALETRNAVVVLFGLLQDAEAAQRGYLLTGQEFHLQPYEHARGTVDQASQRAYALVRGEPDFDDDPERLSEVIGGKLDELGQTIALKQSGRDAEALAIMSADRGQLLMETARETLAAWGHAAEDHFRADVAAQQAGAMTLRLVTLIGGALIVMAIAATAVLASGYTRGLAVANDQIRALNSSLEQRIREQRRAEEQLRQAQKMEAVGQLTGGVAHDFNNLLSVILGSIEMVSERVADAELREVLQRAARAGERGAHLTHSLLAFARRQPLAPRVTDVNRLVLDMQDLLRRTLGETIEIEVLARDGVWSCEVDPGQLQNAVVNLALNARDAMPAGGRLTIETSNGHIDDDYAARHPEVSPGQYVVLTVSDTGTGMAPDVVERAVEPFFTTKQFRHGSGLGLSMVYGFVRQSGGHLSIYSEVGLGTSVRLHLPRSLEAPQAAGPVETPPAPRGTESIMLVEDDADVRELTQQQLRSLGYTVVSVRDASSALALMTKHAVALLITDVVLPGGMNGKMLAEQALERQPELKVLFISGYTADAIVHQGRLNRGEHLLQKPFRQRDLAAKVREVLGPPPAAGSCR